MILWVMYDIKSDKVRTNVAKCCKQAGLLRVQYSVFLGKINTNRKDVLQIQLEDLVDEDEDSVYMFPKSKNELQDTVLIGQAFDKRLITEDVKALFF